MTAAPLNVWFGSLPHRDVYKGATLHNQTVYLPRLKVKTSYILFALFLPPCEHYRNRLFM